VKDAGPDGLSSESDGSDKTEIASGKKQKEDTVPDEEDTDPAEGESGSGEERDSEEDGQEDEATGDRAEDEPEEGEGSDGESISEQPDDVSGEEDEGTNSGDHDRTGDEEDTDRSGEKEDESPDDADSDSEADDTTPTGDTPEDSGDSEEGVDEGVDEPDPEGEAYEKAKREWENKVTEAVEEVLQDVENHANELKTIHDENREKIEEYNATAGSDGPYLVHPDVKDIIGYNEMTDVTSAECIRDRGLKMLGTAGARLTRVFVAESYPRHVHNQYHGRFDMRSFVADPADRRMDIYSRKTGARLDKAAVAFAVDNSESMSGCIGNIYCILSGILHYLGHASIPTEAVGFTAEDTRSSEYRDSPVHLSIIKSFGEPYSSEIMRRCSPPRYRNLTVELDCLRYMVPHLLARPETKKVLFVLCDGRPCLNSADLTFKLTKAYSEYIQLCKNAGLIVFGFGIGCNLQTFFGEDCVSVTTTNVGEQLLSKLTEVLNRPPVHTKRIAA
jgi:hypothetical protein